VATIEIKRGKRSGLWHPHLHVLVARPSCVCLRGRHPYDGGPLCIHGRICCPHALNQCCLAHAWRQITGDSYVVDIRAVRADSEGDMGGAIREVVKYCTKLTDAGALRERRPRPPPPLAPVGRAALGEPRLPPYVVRHAFTLLLRRAGLRSVRFMICGIRRRPCC
jgi:hypothetical protein